MGAAPLPAPVSNPPCLQPTLPLPPPAGGGGGGGGGGAEPGCAAGAAEEAAGSEGQEGGAAGDGGWVPGSVAGGLSLLGGCCGCWGWQGDVADLALARRRGTGADPPLNRPPPAPQPLNHSPTSPAAAANEIDRSLIDLLDQNIAGATVRWRWEAPGDMQGRCVPPAAAAAAVVAPQRRLPSPPAPPAEPLLLHPAPACACRRPSRTRWWSS